MLNLETYAQDQFIFPNYPDENYPNEMAFHIFSFIQNPQDISSILLTSKKWSILGSENLNTILKRYKGERETKLLNWFKEYRYEKGIVDLNFTNEIQIDCLYENIYSNTEILKKIYYKRLEFKSNNDKLFCYKIIFENRELKWLTTFDNWINNENEEANRELLKNYFNIMFQDYVRSEVFKSNSNFIYKCFTSAKFLEIISKYNELYFSKYNELYFNDDIFKCLIFSLVSKMYNDENLFENYIKREFLDKRSNSTFNTEKFQNIIDFIVDNDLSNELSYLPKLLIKNIRFLIQKGNSNVVYNEVALALFELLYNNRKKFDLVKKDVDVDPFSNFWNPIISLFIKKEPFQSFLINKMIILEEENKHILSFSNEFKLISDEIKQASILQFLEQKNWPHAKRLAKEMVKPEEILKIIEQTIQNHEKLAAEKEEDEIRVFYAKTLNKTEEKINKEYVEDEMMFISDEESYEAESEFSETDNDSGEDEDY